ncbi:MAG: cation diffusion facilitator family transporter [Clostridia bacterium]|nr:cation diffusion facilitator family transporter [Clostridia bacterium]
MENKKIANRVSVISIAVNMALSVFKLIAGLIAHSSAMVSDAVHSASDVVSTIAVIAGVNISARESDSGHQYGHERMEAIFSILLSVLLFATGLGIGYGAVMKIIGGNYGELQAPGRLALVAAVISIAVKEWMFHFTKRAAKKINSTALMADAWHHRSDALSSIGSFAGILGARLGLPICDPIAGGIICIFIAKAAWDIFYDATNQLVDKSCDESVCSELRELVEKQEGVVSVDDLKTRLFGSKVYVDVEIGADGNLTLYKAHDIAQRVHDNIEQSFPNVKHCMVHVNPKNIG